MKNIVFKKKFGQNFLTDTNLLSAIVLDSGINSTSTVLEIGAGAGALTAQLAKTAKKVVSVEVDSTLQPVLEHSLGGFENCRVIYADFLSLTDENLQALVGDNFSVVANLPYYITSPILTRLLSSNLKVDSITVMVQAEVANRIAASPGTKDYGVLSVMVQLCGTPQITRKVSRKMFTPQPNVDSSVVRIDCTGRPQDYVSVVEFAKHCFFARRKTLLNNLGRVYKKEQILAALSNLKLQENVRAEELLPQQFATLHKLLQN